MRFLFGLVLAVAIIGGGLFLYAGRISGPVIEIAKPVKYIGQSTPMEVTIAAPRARFSRIQIAFEQNGKQTQLFSLDQPSADVKQDGADRVRITRTVGRQVVPDLKSGPARIVVSADRPVLFGLRKAHSTATRDVQVRLERPQIAVISTKHYLNLGGSPRDQLHRVMLIESADRNRYS